MMKCNRSSVKYQVRVSGPLDFRPLKKGDLAAQPRLKESWLPSNHRSKLFKSSWWINKRLHESDLEWGSVLKYRWSSTRGSTLFECSGVFTHLAARQKNSQTRHHAIRVRDASCDYSSSLLIQSQYSFIFNSIQFNSNQSIPMITKFLAEMLLQFVATLIHEKVIMRKSLKKFQMFWKIHKLNDTIEVGFNKCVKYMNAMSEIICFISIFWDRAVTKIWK